MITDNHRADSMGGLLKSIGGRQAWAHLLARLLGHATGAHAPSSTQEVAHVPPTVHLPGLPHAWSVLSARHGPTHSRRRLSDSVRITCTFVSTIPSHPNLILPTRLTQTPAHPTHINRYLLLPSTLFFLSTSPVFHNQGRYPPRSVRRLARAVLSSSLAHPRHRVAIRCHRPACSQPAPTRQPTKTRTSQCPIQVRTLLPHFAPIATACLPLVI
jgi:hypothetical protein